MPKIAQDDKRTVLCSVGVKAGQYDPDVGRTQIKNMFTYCNAVEQEGLGVRFIQVEKSQQSAWTVDNIKKALRLKTMTEVNDAMSARGDSQADIEARGKLIDAYIGGYAPVNIEEEGTAFI